MKRLPDGCISRTSVSKVPKWWWVAIRANEPSSLAFLIFLYHIFYFKLLLEVRKGIDFGNHVQDLTLKEAETIALSILKQVMEEKVETFILLV